MATNEGKASLPEKPVDILLATYNGERYLAEQLDSLLKQDYSNWRLWVRDDGSTDNTLKILEAFAEQDSRIHILESLALGKGASASFMRLLALAPQKADYLMFCDQDDVWFPDKISATLSAMQQLEEIYAGRPVLVHCDLQIVDEALGKIHPSLWLYGQLKPERHELRHLIIHNNVTGCAMMINCALRQRVPPDAASIIMHDWFLALIAASFGVIGTIDRPLMLYRQHTHNTLGAKNMRAFGTIRKFLQPGATYRRINERLRQTQLQAAQFLYCFEHALSHEHVFMLKHYSTLAQKSFLQRRLWIIRLKTFKAGWLKNIGLLLAV